MRYGYRRNRYYEGDREFEPNDFDDEDPVREIKNKIRQNVKTLKQITDNMRGNLDWLDEKATRLGEKNPEELKDVIQKVYDLSKKLHFALRSINTRV